MIIKVRANDTIGNAILRMLVAMGTTAPEGALSFEQLNEAQERTGGGGPRTHYWAKFPILPDGVAHSSSDRVGPPDPRTIDRVAASDVVRRNLLDLGAHTVNGMIYNDVAAKTLAGEIATEPQLARDRIMKRGSSQRAIQVLYQMGLIDRGRIEKGE